MQYLIGVIVGAILTGITIYLVNIVSSWNKPGKILVSQSRSHSVLAPMTITIGQHKPLDTQATRYYDSTRIRTVFTEDAAYWIKDNTVYKARVENNFIVENSAEVLDMIAMDKVQLEEMIFIIEKLTEGMNNDSGYSGDSKF